MAFQRKYLERLAGGVAKLYHYNAQADTAATVTGSGYFGGMEQEFDKGDVIIVVGAGQTTVDLAIVTSARGVTPVTTATVEAVTTT